jgi:hypothetical protein
MALATRLVGSGNTFALEPTTSSAGLSNPFSALSGHLGAEPCSDSGGAHDH